MSPRSASLERGLVADGLAFTYRRAESEPPPGALHRPQVERWVVAVTVDDPGHPDHGHTIGDAGVVVLNVGVDGDVRDLTDPESGEWREAAGEGLEGPDPDAGASQRMLVLERVWVDPDHRGHGLGPVIAAAVLERLGRGCHLAACFPAPFEGECRPEDRAGAVEALSRIWAQVGFRHWRDGVWMLDLEQRPTAGT